MKKIKNYVLDDQIGIGKYGVVFKGLNLTTNEPVAIKIIKKSLLNNQIKRELLLQEIKVMKKLNEQVPFNKNIIKFVEYIETAKNCYIIMELCNSTTLNCLNFYKKKGGDLKQYLKKTRNFEEKTCLEKFKQILNGMKILSENNIVHRDLKTANIFIHDGELKIGDFGFACEGVKEMVKLGTPLYMAPELLHGESYSNKVDVWALGVILYQMLFGDFPYKAPNEEKLKEVTKVPIDFEKLDRQISKETEEILRRMLEPSQEKRISLDELFKLELFNQKQSQEVSMLMSPINKEVKSFGTSNDIPGENTKDTENTTKSFNAQSNGGLTDEWAVYQNLGGLFIEGNGVQTNINK